MTSAPHPFRVSCEKGGKAKKRAHSASAANSANYAAFSCNLSAKAPVSLFRKGRRMADGSSTMPGSVLQRFRHGDLDAFEALFREHQRPVYGWILRIVRNAAAAEDLTVETFWRIHRAHDRFQPEFPFEPWARRIATRAALDWLRAQRPEVELTAEMVGTLPSASKGDPGIAAEIRLKTALAFSRLAAQFARRGGSGRGGGAAAQRGCRGPRHLRWRR